MTPEQRFWVKVDRSGGPDACWPWLTYLNERGYGVHSNTWAGTDKAHRVAYLLMKGPIPTGLTLDHLCRNKACVNPAHLEPVTAGENVLRGTNPPAMNARKTHCIHGHRLGEPLRDGRRQCVLCRRRRNHAYQARLAAKAVS